MADNFEAIEPGSGSIFAASDIDGVKYPIKIIANPDGTRVDFGALLGALAGYVDGVEGLVTSSNTKLDTVHADLATTLAGLIGDLKIYTDGLEALVTSSNTKLDTVHTDLATTLAGLIGDLKTYTDGLETLIAATNSALAGGIGLAAGGEIVGKFGIDQTTPGTTNAVQEPSVKGAEAIAASDTVDVAVRRQFLINCTVAGNVKVRFSDDSLLTFPVSVGLTILPWAVKRVYVTGTTATATFYNLV